MTDNLPTAPPARGCSECTLCCKIMGIKEIDKPPGVWCGHCSPARGCAIYESRPQECRKFVCGWLHSPGLDERWKPSFCKFLLADDGGDTHIVVDPVRPGAPPPRSGGGAPPKAVEGARACSATA
jgi:hypothetical protein